MSDASKAINELARDRRYSKEEMIKRLEHLITQLELGQQLELHSSLSEEALSMIYSFRKRLAVAPAVQEHLVWRYFKGGVSKSGDSIDAKLFDEMIHEFIDSGSLGVESIIIQVVKSDILTESQLEKAKSVLTSKAFEKEYLACSFRKKIDSGMMLDSGDIHKLLEIRAYSILELAIDKKAVTSDGLNCFVAPGEGTSDKKMKLNLFRKAQLNRTLS
ncbi:hypothetical protein [Paenibacillus tyrfis]|uniref:Uncharacterized protein n=1 Tax=Paenibacillus tyrfis TaxID=1501230 RepID=A0A081NYJ4_9BACL|nr:hypothetical protein [Paenibacillus tyrfis]KEQ23517.1 hypothetical protein ET33_15395 [Paenibacillus tyrfis]